jgi:hypothetical protein
MMERSFSWFIHGYQPPGIPEHGYLGPTKNLAEQMEAAYIPVVESLANGDSEPKNIQFQGITIDLYLNAKDSTLSDNAKYFFGLCKQAHEKGNSVGASSYSHAILPLLSNAAKYFSIKADIDTIKKNIEVEPTWFWAPEGAYDIETIKLLNEKFPKLVPVVPDSCFYAKELEKVSESDFRDGSDIVNIEQPDFVMKKAFVCNRFLKDAMMAGSYKSAMRFGDQFEEALDYFDPSKDITILATDWENGEIFNTLGKRRKGKSNDGPYWAHLNYKATKEGKPIWENNYNKVHFRQISKLDPKKTVKNFKCSSWEPVASESNPLPYWAPTGKFYQELPSWKKEITNNWQELYRLWDKTFQKIILKKAELKEGKYDDSVLYQCVDRIFQDKSAYELLKKASGALISCVPWHVLSPWGDLKLYEHFVKGTVKENMDLLFGLAESLKIEVKNDRKRAETLIENMLNIAAKEGQNLETDEKTKYYKKLDL